MLGCQADVQFVDHLGDEDNRPMVALNGEIAEAEATGKVVVVLADRLRQQRGSLSVR